MSKAYKPGTDEPQPYEVIGMAPAGALASSGADMGKFMIAHLNHTADQRQTCAADVFERQQTLFGASGDGARFLP